MAVRPLADRVYYQLKEQIDSLKLLPGVPLREVELSRAFRVSRTPIREALRRLHAEGRVVIVGGRGASVGSVSLRELLEAYEIRELLEPFAAVNAARRGIDSVEVQRFIDRSERVTDTPSTAEELAQREAVDQDFHALITRVAGNELLARIVLDMHSRIRRVFAHLGGGGRFREGRQEHLQILRAIQNYDENLAAELMRTHLQKSKSRLFGVEARDRRTSRSNAR